MKIKQSFGLVVFMLITTQHAYADYGVACSRNIKGGTETASVVGNKKEAFVSFSVSYRERESGYIYKIMDVSKYSFEYIEKKVPHEISYSDSYITVSRKGDSIRSGINYYGDNCKTFDEKEKSNIKKKVTKIFNNKVKKAADKEQKALEDRMF